MYKFYDFQCTVCGYQFEHLLDRKEIKEGLIETPCEKCKGVAKTVISNPRHYKHASWSTWRMHHTG